LTVKDLHDAGRIASVIWEEQTALIFVEDLRAHGEQIDDSK